MADSITFALTAGLFGFLTLPKAHKPPKEMKKTTQLKVSTYLKEIKGGFSIVLHSLLAVSLFGTAILNFALGVSMAVLPAFTDAKGGAELYGYLLAAESTGILIGSLISAWAERFRFGYFGIIAFTLGAGFWFLAAIKSYIDCNV